MAVPKTFIFVDGENLVMRYQAMMAQGRKPKKEVRHIQDTFVWSPSVTTWSCMDIQRVTYYTSATGDPPRIAALRAEIASTAYSFTHEYGGAPEATAQIVPRIFHKAGQSRKSRNVDINIVIDMIRASFQNATELLVLLSGDGDYLPLIDESMRQGKPVWVCAFSSGLNESLVSSVDCFQSLDEFFFEPVEP